MNDQLRNIISQILTIRLDDTLEDEAIVALARIYISLQNLVTANGLDNEFGDRRIYEAQLDSLYEICRRRCSMEYSFGRRCRMASVLYSIVYSQMRGIDIRKADDWHSLISLLTEEWRQGVAPKDNDSEAEYWILRCIADAYSFTIEADRLNRRDFIIFRERIAEWAGSLDEHGRWDGCRPRQVLNRIAIMLRYIALFCDNSVQEQVDMALDAFCKFHLEKNLSDDILSLLLEINEWYGGDNAHRLERIIDQIAMNFIDDYNLPTYRKLQPFIAVVQKQVRRITADNWANIA